MGPQRAVQPMVNITPNIHKDLYRVRASWTGRCQSPSTTCTCNTLRATGSSNPPTREGFSPTAAVWSSRQGIHWRDQYSQYPQVETTGRKSPVVPTTHMLKVEDRVGNQHLLPTLDSGAQFNVLSVGAARRLRAPISTQNKGRQCLA
jgi:hypothetical protein